MFRCSVLHDNMVAWNDYKTSVVVELASGESLQAKRLILALGSDYRSFPVLNPLNLHCTKGQVIHTTIPAKISFPLPVSGYGYAVPVKNRLIVGTTYEHSPSDVHPTSAGVDKILALTEQMLPWIHSAEIKHTSAGIRVGVPGTRLPMVGPLTRRVWILTGLGSKGCYLDLILDIIL